MPASLKYITSGFILALILLLPMISWTYGLHWGVEDTPLLWLANGLHYMATFFHEIGHTVFYWFYGYLALPAFDFEHGGGMSYEFGRQMPLNYAVYAALALGVFYFREERPLQILLVATGIFHALTAYNDSHEVIIGFMGHGSEILIGAFFLVRAFFDLAPRGSAERLLNAVIGFGMIFKNMLMCWTLMTDEIQRMIYFQQKGQHGFGDFSRIDTALPFASLEEIAALCFALCLAALIGPAVAYALPLRSPKSKKLIY